MDFAPLLDSGETLSAVSSVALTPTTTSMLTSSSHSVSGTKARFRLAAGLDNTKYKATVTVTTSGGNTVQGEMFVQVKDL